LAQNTQSGAARASRAGSREAV